MKLYLRKFDFDEWMALAQNNPDEFEKCRVKFLERVIAKAPIRIQPRLRGLQWRIDMVRQKAATPLAGCIKLNSMMWDFIYAEKGFLQTLKILTGNSLATRQSSAKIYCLPAGKPK